MRSLPLILAFTTCACSTDIVEHLGSDASNNARDAGPAQDAASLDAIAEDADAPEDAGPRPDLGAADAQTADVQITDVQTNDAGVHEIPSAQNVFVQLVNTSTTDVWIPSMGYNCDLFSVTGSSGVLPIQLGFQCICECPAPVDPHVEWFDRLPPGSQISIRWDARSLALYIETVICSPDGQFTAERTHGELQPVAPGAYTITIPYERRVPANCTVNGNQATCTAEFGGAFPPAVQQLCPVTQTLPVGLSLPAQGDVTVTATF